MHTLNYSPLNRFSVGFDNLASLLNAVSQTDQSQRSYPPYNIELVDDDKYRVTMAVAGFTQDEIAIVSEENALTVSGKQKTDDKSKYLYQGLANRSFERKFQLADYVKVTHAKLQDGLLHIDLVRDVPEAMKPRKIEILTADIDQLEQKQTEKAA